MVGRRIQRRRPRRQGRRIPRAITALVPFSVQRNKQIVSIPSHSEGLTIYRKIRCEIGTPAGGGGTNLNFLDIFAQTRKELGVTEASTHAMSFTPSKVDVYVPGPNTINIHITGSPAGNGLTEISAPIFSSSDQAIAAGIAHVACVIPKAATFTLASTQTLAAERPFVNVTTSVAATQLYVDVTGSFTVKKLAGLP